MCVSFCFTALNLTCTTGAVPGRQTFDCLTNQPVSVMCSFDGGPAENCSLPLEVDIDRFGTDNHTVVITVTDEFGQSLSVSFNFALIERELELCSVCTEVEIFVLTQHYNHQQSNLQVRILLNVNGYSGI